ncbi:hypothetical protein [Rhizobium chutanense]|uniref:hypothetical protein n=1 Tax=Rhizobium chutanense TaxID=2035448 RepID=UPI001FDFE30B
MQEDRSALNVFEATDEHNIARGSGETRQAASVTGNHAPESEVVRVGLRELQERENAVEHWLRTDVAATYDAHKADPRKAKPLDEAWKRIEARMDEIDRQQDW